MRRSVKKGRLAFYLLFALLFVGTLAYTLLAGRVGISLFTGSDRYYGDKTFENGNTALSERITSLDIGWVAGKVEIRVTEEGEGVTLTETGSETPEGKNRMTYQLTDGMLTLRFAEKKAIFLSNYKKPKTLTVEIPRAFAAYLDEITVHTISAEVSVEGIDGTELLIDSASGSAFLSGVTAKRIHISGKSGGASIENCRCDRLTVTMRTGSVRIAGLAGQTDETVDHCYIETVSGNVTAKDAALRELTVETKKGAVSGQAVTVTETLTAVGDSGALTFDSCQSGALALESGNGNIVWAGELPESAEITTHAGAVALFLPADASFVLTYDTATGQSAITFPGLTAEEEEGVYRTGGEAKAALSVDTFSGNLSVGLFSGGGLS